jgi:mannosylfructose-phosphate synthase
VDIWTRWFEDQSELEPVAEQVRIIRVPCGGNQFIPKEYLSQKLPQWSENALRFIKKHGLKYEFIDSHYWDAGVAGQHLSEALDVPHVHTPHSLGLWKKRQMENDYPGDAAKFEKQYNFTEHPTRATALHGRRPCVATTPQTC